MNFKTSLNLNNFNLINFISWCVFALPIILIFSNSLADIIVVTASILFIFQSIKNKKWEWLNEPWIKIGFLIYLWLIIASFFAYNQELALSRSLPWIRFIIFSASLQFLFLIKKKNRDRLLLSVFIAIIYVGIEMLTEYFTGTSLYSKIRFNFFDSLYFSGGPHRISGPFKDAPKTGIFLAYFALPAILGITKFISKKYSTLFIILSLTISLFLIYISGHRSSILSIFLSLIFLSMYFFWSKKRIIFLFSSILLFGIIIYNSIPNKTENIYIKTYKELKNYNNSPYGSLSITALKMFKEHPFFGIGLKNYRVACENDKFLSKGHLGTGYGVSPWKGHYNEGLKKYFEATCSSHPHNLYLTWLAETGAIGFILFTVLIFIFCKDIFSQRKIIINQIVALGIISSIFPKFLPMMPSLNFFSNWNAICVWLLIGWMYSLIKIKRENL